MSHFYKRQALVRNIFQYLYDILLLGWTVVCPLDTTMSIQGTPRLYIHVHSITSNDAEGFTIFDHLERILIYTNVFIPPKSELKSFLLY